MVEMDVTQIATYKETLNPFMFLASLKIPILSGPSPKNQSRVNPFHGREGKLELLNASTIITISGEKSSTKYNKIKAL
jgi:hypothetical protein